MTSFFYSGGINAIVPDFFCVECVADGPYLMVMEGLGERVTPLSLGRADSPDGRWWLVIANPGFCVATGDVYSRVTLALTSPHGPVTSIVSALKDGDLRSVARGFFNGLQTVCRSLQGL